ncbi:hypothetical protein [Bradyrhizobium australiense]|uniref:Uncharacterized protein n=1 Tax=Bradyrhizobium australiense TaxID=2721161 RepID=A0A7Y4GSA2_9BRAD|nr:hypothetical protein [Bradyrhizobium australiense]NOJ40911.1 hypothetical protein [Bradyrhizobium australiense]
MLKPVTLENRWRASDDRLREIIDALAAELRALEQSRKQRVRARKAADARKFELAIEVILCNFVAISFVDRDRWLMVRLANHASSVSPIYGNLA